MSVCLQNLCYKIHKFNTVHLIQTFMQCKKNDATLKRWNNNPTQLYCMVLCYLLVVSHVCASVTMCGMDDIIHSSQAALC